MVSYWLARAFERNPLHGHAMQSMRTFRIEYAHLHTHTHSLTHDIDICERARKKIGKRDDKNALTRSRLRASGIRHQAHHNIISRLSFRENSYEKLQSTSTATLALKHFLNKNPFLICSQKHFILINNTNFPFTKAGALFVLNHFTLQSNNVALDLVFYLIALCWFFNCFVVILISFLVRNSVE